MESDRSQSRRNSRGKTRSPGLYERVVEAETKYNLSGWWAMSVEEEVDVQCPDDCRNGGKLRIASRLRLA
jgi:hypothetical protein